MTHGENQPQGHSNKPPGTRESPRHATAQPSILNLPNLFSGLRFIGSFGLLGLALAGGGPWLAPLLAFLILTDWVDGKLAIYLHQRTVFGARLDSLADVTFYAAVLLTLLWLKSSMVVAELVWIVPAILSYAVSSAIGLMKFGGIPTYHTRAAKTSWLLAGVAAFAVLADWSIWPLRVAAVAVLVTNLEAICITLVLPACRVDVMSLYHAVRFRKTRAAPTEDGVDSR